MSQIRIGISGWTYPPWRGGAFYPKGWPQKRELEYASHQVNSIEINSSFYSLQRPGSYKAWHRATPDGFLFSIKGGRFITHIKRLKDIEAPLANFFASGVLCLRDKLGPILWQLPPSFKYDRDRIEDFFRLLPCTLAAAAALARRHDPRMRKRSWTEACGVGRLRHSLEVRHESFENSDFIRLLRKYKIALVVADTAGKWPFMEDTTSDFVYVRLHGGSKLYVSGYSAQSLEKWAKKVRSWSKGRTPSGTRLVAPRPTPEPKGRDVFVYFDNDAKVRAPFDTMSLSRRLGVRNAQEGDGTVLEQMPG